MQVWIEQNFSLAKLDPPFEAGGTLIVDANNIVTPVPAIVLPGNYTLDMVFSLRQSSAAFSYFSTVTIMGVDAFLDGDYTGSVAVAQAINRSLAGRAGPIVPLVAETGGINVMIVDATALR